jgi:hypothetical protein
VQNPREGPDSGDHFILLAERFLSLMHVEELAVEFLSSLRCSGPLGPRMPLLLDVPPPFGKHTRTVPDGLWHRGRVIHDDARA